MQKPIHLRSLSFSFDSSGKNIIDNLNTSFQKGWTGLIGANGCGKSTLLKLLSGDLEPSSGIILNPYKSYYCAQESSIKPNNFSDFVESHDQEALRLKTTLSLHEFLSKNWNQLSCGEQKRIQLACALWTNPKLLLVDEPTNHLDETNKRYIINTLSEFKGVGILVSHDRDLLDKVCSKCLFFIGNRIYDISGSYSQAKSHLDQKFLSEEHKKNNLKKKAQSLKEETQRLKSIQDGSKNKLSKSQISSKDKDAKNKINLAKLTGKDGSLGQKKQNIQNRINNLNHQLKDFHTVKDYSGDISFDIEHPKSGSKLLLFKEQGSIVLPNHQKLYFPDLTLKTSQKIGIMGDNGLGKTSLIQKILHDRWLKTNRFFYLKQELSSKDIEDLRLILKNFDKESYAFCLQIVARLGSDSKQFFKNENLSAGEARKLAIACSIVNKVELFILDEPTNHLDLPSIENLEKALKESPLTLLIVSHDKPFIRHICTHVWQINKSKNGDSYLEEKMP